MKVTASELPGVVRIDGDRHVDVRGAFAELWQAERFQDLGLDATFVQDNVSTSRRGVVRGLHFQWPHGQGKLVSAVLGTIRDVVVDVRVGSPSFGRSLIEVLDAEAAAALWVPAGFAHGFEVVSELAVVVYKCTGPRVAEAERVVRWDDATLAIGWQTAAPILSERDAGAPTLAELAARGMLPTL